MSLLIVALAFTLVILVGLAFGSTPENRTSEVYAKNTNGYNGNWKSVKTKNVNRRIDHG